MFNRGLQVYKVAIDGWLAVFGQRFEAQFPVSRTSDNVMSAPANEWERF
jgi:hypothetical protein